MKRYILAGAAALALALPAAAQDTMDHSEMAMEMSAQQKTMYDGWPADRRTMYDGWPHDYQMYFWTLNPTQMNGWWVLTDDQRARVYAMPPQQRIQAWTAIAAQMGGSTPAVTASTAATASMAGNVNWVSNAMVQPITADQAPAGDPPICTPNQQDNCINAWEAGKRGPGVNRPLDHWPGKPASEM